jgi:hypothetical protein
MDKDAGGATSQRLDRKRNFARKSHPDVRAMISGFPKISIEYRASRQQPTWAQTSKEESFVISPLIPAKAGSRAKLTYGECRPWIPACAGMSGNWSA